MIILKNKLNLCGLAASTKANTID